MLLRITEADERRFWPKVGLPDSSGCMLWLAGKTKRGYGKMRVNGSIQYAHRIALTLAAGPPADPSLEAAHAPEICHRPDCVAPEHLRWATRAENAADQRLDGTAPVGESHPAGKLTAEQVTQIRFEYALGGVLQRELAARYGVARSQISRITTGARWA